MILSAILQIMIGLVLLKQLSTIVKVGFRLPSVFRSIKITPANKILKSSRSSVEAMIDDSFDFILSRIVGGKSRLTVFFGDVTKMRAELRSVENRVDVGVARWKL